MESLIYQIVLVQEDEVWWAYIPDMPGVYGMGATESAAKKDISDALSLYLESARVEGMTIPESHIRKIETDRIQVPAVA